MVGAVSTQWLTTLRRQGEEYFQLVAQHELARLRAGQPQGPVTLAGNERRFALLSQKDTWFRLEEERERLTDNSFHRRQVDRLRHFVATTLERHAARGVRNQLFQRQTTAVLDAEHQQLPALAALNAIETSGDPTRRAALGRALVTVRQDWLPLQYEAQQLQREAAASLGGEDYPRWRAQLSRFDLDHVLAETELLLATTTDMARDGLAWLTRRLNQPQQEAIPWYELAYASQAPELHSLLAPGELWRLTDFLTRLGLEPERVHQLPLIDAAGLLPRARSLTLDVSGTVYLVHRSAPGLATWRETLHHLLIALQAAHVKGGAAFEARRLSDPALCRGWAILFDHLLLNPVWGRRVLKLSRPQADDVMRLAAAAALLELRRDAALLQAEVTLSASLDEAEENRQELLYQALGLRLPSGCPLAEPTEQFEVAHRLRAALFEGTAHFQLREQFDEDWFLNPRAGELLRGIFGSDQLLEMEETGSRLLEHPLTHGPVVRRFEEVLG
jgi:hypothetical protein